MQVGEIFVKLGIVSDTKELKKFDSGLKDISKTIGFVVGSIVAVAYAFDKYVSSVTKASVADQNFNNQTGISIDSLKKWQTAGHLADTTLSFEQIASAIQAVQQNLTEIRLGGGNIGAFQLLGIDVAGKNAVQVLEDVREAIKGLDDSTAVNLISKLGLPPNFINALRLSNKEFEKLGNQRFLNDNQRKKIVEMGTALTQFKMSFRTWFDSIGAMIAPTATGFLELLNTFTEMSFALNNMLANSELFKATWNTVGMVLNAIKETVKYIFMALDDIFVYLAGGDSLLGDFINTAIKPFNELMQNIKNFKMPSLGSMFSGVKESIPEWIRNPLGISGKKDGSNKNTSFNNNYYIQSQGDSDEVAEEIIKRQQRQFNYAHEDLTTAPVI